MRVTGDKVVLRDKRRSDVANDYSWSVDPELCRLDAAQPTSLSFRDASILYEEELLYPPPRRQRFAIETPEGLHIGNCMIYDMDKIRARAELGIMIGDRRYWSRSYGTDAVKTLLSYAFSNMRLKSLYLHTLEWNVRAQKSFAKAGFVVKGKVRRNGHDFISMEITRDEWERINAKHGSRVARA